MIKRTLYFGNPAYMGMRNSQLVVRLPEVDKNNNLPDSFKKDAEATIPLEDIGVIILDHSRITITQALISALVDNNTSIICCSENHMPVGMMMPLNVNHTQQERFTTQMEASLPLKKQLWQQTISAKIKNQAALLSNNGINTENMKYWASSVRSGDPDNYEARAAAFYWQSLFSHIDGFRREREGMPPNNLLNYGYAILRAVVARSLLASGLLPTFGIHHKNKYNAFCLADDIMEPYRPYVDEIVLNISRQNQALDELTVDIKKELFLIPATDIMIDGERSPLMVGMQRTTASLYRCYEGTNRKILYPEMN